MKSKKALTIIHMIIGLILILLLTIAFIRPLFTKKTIIDNAEMSEIEKIAGAEEENCRCIKGLLQGETQVCSKDKPKPENSYREVEKPSICKAWIDCNDKCYKKV